MYACNYPYSYVNVHNNDIKCRARTLCQTYLQHQDQTRWREGIGDKLYITSKVPRRFAREEPCAWMLPTTRTEFSLKSDHDFQVIKMLYQCRAERRCIDQHFLRLLLCMYTIWHFFSLECISYVHSQGMWLKMRQLLQLWPFGKIVVMAYSD